MHEVRHEEAGQRGTFYLEGSGARTAAMTYSRAGEAMVLIDHTEVADSLRGQGAGRALLEAAVRWARANSLSIVPVCPFAKAQFAKDERLRDVLSR